MTGVAGCGKTRLAAEVAVAVDNRYRDGVYWVELASLSNPQLVASALARAAGVIEQPGRSLPEELLEALQEKQALIVMDNCEHLLSACRAVVEVVMQAPGVSILATSREPLGLAGEMRYPLGPMALPPDSLSAPELVQFDAIRLFVERARATLPEFSLTADNAGVVVSICHHLDGLPLAIELASARLNVLALEQIAARLNDRFALLSSTAETSHSHHRTLRAALDWSYDLLTGDEQAPLARLSVFAGSFSLAAAEAVGAGEELARQPMLDRLSSLVSKSLVMADTLSGREARYRLLETVRQYAQQKLMDSGEWQVTRDRHLRYFLAVAEQALPKLSGQEQKSWLDRLEADYDNIRVAMSWSLESTQVEAGLRIANAIYQFWTIRDYAEEGLAWMKRLLAQTGSPVSRHVRANALAYAAFLAGFRGNTPAQIAFGHEAEAVAEAAGEQGKRALVWALAAQAYGARAENDYHTELALGERVIQLNRELGDRYQLGVTLSVYSFSAMALGKYHVARAMLDEALPLLREIGNPYRIAMALNYSGDLARCERGYPAAQKAYEESLSLLRHLDAPRDLASVLQNLGHTCLHLGDLKQGDDLFGESLTLQLAQRNTPGVAECLIGFAALAIVRDLPAAGARLLAAAVGIGGKRIVSDWAATRLDYEHYLALVLSRLGETQFQAECAAGRMLNLQQAVQNARNLFLAPEVPAPSKQDPGSLTARERDVVALIAQGRSNGEIADELVVSKRTVETHIANIRSKLALASRAQIVRWAFHTGLVEPTGGYNSARDGTVSASRPPSSIS